MCKSLGGGLPAIGACLAGLALVTMVYVPRPAGAQTSVFINELHYDNQGPDSGEAVEVAGPAGTDLSGWSVELYNGNNGRRYDSQSLSGTIPDLCGGFGVVVAAFSNIQNGAPDGLALVDPTGGVQFLSYEGTFTAANGPAAGLTSTDIGVSESNTADGNSLQLGGSGSVFEDFTFEAPAPNTFGACNANQTFTGGGPPPPPPTSSIVLNEVDADQVSTDTQELIELFDGGVGNTSLDGLVLVVYNGADDASYNLGGHSSAIDLDGFATNAQGYFLIGNAALAGVDIVIGDSSLQNGADAVALYFGDGTDFPNGTPVTTSNLVDAVVYDTNDGDDPGLLVLLNAGEPQLDEGGGGSATTESNQRCPNGGGGTRNTSGFVQAPPTPGAANACGGGPPAVTLTLNEVDADQTSTDTGELIEIFDGGVGNTPLDGLVVVAYNGSDDASYNLGGHSTAIDLDGFSTDANGYFLIANATVPGVDIVIGDSSLQNGADAVALYFGDGSDFPNDTPVTTTNLLDAVVYDTNDPDDAALLVLLNSGEPQLNEGANSATTESNQRCPNGEGGQRNTSGFVQAPPTPKADNDCPAPPPPPPPGGFEISDIQGNGLASPFDGVTVTLEENVVTAVGPDGFAIQTPDVRADADPDTSNGVFVFTGTPPTVAVGDSVDVMGTVQEFFDLTEIAGNPTVVVRSSGNPLPAAVVLDAMTPSPNQPQSAVELERLEGMRVVVTGGSVCSGNQEFGTDPVAEVFITAAPSRCFREPGIEFPGGGGTIPTWDGNPEVFELDPDRLGLANLAMNGGSSFDATGIIGFEFGGYELWPTSLSVTPAPLPGVVRARNAGELSVGSLNLFRLFDDNDDPPQQRSDGANRNDTVVSTQEYNRRRAKFADYIVNVLDAPDILGVQEAEKLEVLEDLAAEIQALDATVVYTAFLVEGNDLGTIDVGFLVRDTVFVQSVTQLGKDEILPFDGSLLHDRPPLLLEGDYTANGLPFPLAVMVNHTRSLSGIDDPSDGERVRTKRLEQAQSIAQKVQDFQTQNPSTPLVVIGDLNAFQFTDGFVDVVGQMAGDFNPAENTLSGPDLVSPNLTKQVLTLPVDEQYSFNFRGNAQVLDHALTTTNADTFVRGFELARGNSDAPEDLINDASTPLASSDHDGLVLFLMSDADGDGIPDDVDPN